MDYFSRLDGSVKEMGGRIVDDTGRSVRAVKVAREPEALLQVLLNPGSHFKRIGLEAGLLSHWLFSAPADAGLPVICVETRHMRQGRFFSHALPGRTSLANSPPLCSSRVAVLFSAIDRIGSSQLWPRFGHVEN